MMMQWLVNEWKAFQEQINQRVEGLANLQKESSPLVERVTKLEGELRAMKARLGKNKNNKEPETIDR